MSILIVEDNPISLRTVEMILQSNGLETVSAKSGRQALERLKEVVDIQLVLSDLMMPDMDGYQLLEAMSRDAGLRAIPVVVMTSLSDGDTVRRVVTLGCKGYVVKPVREETLIPKVRQTMRDLPNGAEVVLKPKFKVLEETGLDPTRYDALMDSFHSDLRETSQALSAVAETPGPEHPGRKQVLALLDAASVLASGRFPMMLDGFKTRGVCDWFQMKDAMSATLSAVAAAVEKRERLREKLAKAEQSQAEQ